MTVIGWIVFGLIVGVVGKLLMPGKDPGGDAVPGPEFPKAVPKVHPEKRHTPPRSHNAVSRHPDRPVRPPSGPPYETATPRGCGIPAAE